MSKIEWTDETWNPIVGCSVVSPGCTNCYAMRLAGTRLRHLPRYSGLTTPTKAGPVWTGAINPDRHNWTLPRTWKKPRRVFVNSMGDLFHHSVSNDQLDELFAVMRDLPRHTFQVLTKRADRLAEYTCGRRWLRDARHIWLGVSAEDQQRADERIPYLLQAAASVRFVSFEPLLGPVRLNGLWTWCPKHDSAGGFCVGACPHRYGIDWAIIGGESGPAARFCDYEWIRRLRDDLQFDSIPVFVKQVGSRPLNHDAPHERLGDRSGAFPDEWPDDLRVREMPDAR